MTHIWEAIRGELVSALIVVLGAGATALVAWLRSKARKWDAVRRAVREVEDSAYDATHPPTGRQKKADAMAKLRSSQPGIKPADASKMIETVLPEVRADSEPPTDRSPE